MQEALLTSAGDTSADAQSTIERIWHAGVKEAEASEAFGEAEPFEIRRVLAVSEHSGAARLPVYPGIEQRIILNYI